MDLFKGAFIGMHDKNSKPIHEGNSVQFIYIDPELTIDPKYKGELTTCKVIYNPEWAMFCLLWTNGYMNKYPMNPSKYEVIP
jgi:hypothetical protein